MSNKESIDEYARITSIDTQLAESREILRRSVQASSLERADAIIGLSTQQQALEIARKMLSDPN